MRKAHWHGIILAVLALLLTSGCGEVAIGSRPGDFTVRYSWTAASVPPPFHLEYDVTIGPGLTGSVVYLPDYPGADTPTWSAEFTLTETDLDILYQLILRQGVLSRSWREVNNPPIGGDTSGLQVQANGKTVRVHSLMVDSARLEPINEAITKLVPREIWDTFDQQREQYEQEHQRK